MCSPTSGWTSANGVCNCVCRHSEEGGSRRRVASKDSNYYLRQVPVGMFFDSWLPWLLTAASWNEHQQHREPSHRWVPGHSPTRVWSLGREGVLFHAIRRRGQWDEGIFGCNQFAQRKVQQRWCENGCRNSCTRRPRWTIPPNFRSWSDRKWKLERWALGNAWLVAASEHSAETMVNRMPIADMTYQINFVFCKVNSANVTVSGQSFKSIRNCLF